VKRNLLPSLILLLLFSVLSAQAQPLKAWAYAVPWMPDGWKDQPLQDLERVVVFDMSVDALGEINGGSGWPERWQALRARAEVSGTKLELGISCLNEITFDAIFSSAAARTRLLEGLTELARGDDVAGLHIDFEVYGSVPTAAVTEYQNFLLLLASRLHSMNKSRELSVFYPAGVDVAVYDARTLAQTDYIVLQGYDMHWLHSTHAGPLSPLAGEQSMNWQAIIASALQAGATRDKLLMGFPLYGYEWPVLTDDARSQTLGEGQALYFSASADDAHKQPIASIKERIRHYGVVYEPESGSAYFQYKKSDVFFAGWFEDEVSLRKKARFLHEQGLSGIAFFALGYDRGQLVKRFMHERH
jgi:spore germination protein YaaH